MTETWQEDAGVEREDDKVNKSYFLSSDKVQKLFDEIREVIRRPFWRQEGQRRRHEVTRKGHQAHGTCGIPQEQLQTWAPARRIAAHEERRQLHPPDDECSWLEAISFIRAWPHQPPDKDS